jgi:hypothetical protein
MAAYRVGDILLLKGFHGKGIEHETIIITKVDKYYYWKVFFVNGDWSENYGHNSGIIDLEHDSDLIGRNGKLSIAAQVLFGRTGFDTLDENKEQ